jgi:hypothetical protein
MGLAEIMKCCLDHSIVDSPDDPSSKKAFGYCQQIFRYLRQPPFCVRRLDGARTIEIDVGGHGVEKLTSRRVGSNIFLLYNKNGVQG